MGRSYSGFQRQPSGQAIENYLEMAFIKSDLIYSFDHNSYRGTSRTDQGVNALSNVFVVDLSVAPNLLVVNSHLPDDIIVWSFAEIPDNFNPRKKVSKHYRYILSQKLLPTPSILDGLSDYLGTHNFTPFIKKHGAGADDPICTISDIQYQFDQEYVYIDIIGDNFGREQIRKMIGFFLDLKNYSFSPREVLQEQLSVDIRSAPSEGLILYSIRFDDLIKWKNEDRIVYKFDHLDNYHNILSKYVREQLIHDLSKLF